MDASVANEIAIVAATDVVDDVVDVSDVDQEVPQITFEATDVARQYTISWDAIEGAESYVVKTSIDDGESWITYRRTEDDTTSATIKGVYVGKAYTYRVYGITPLGSMTSDYAEGTIAPVSLTSAVDSYSNGDEISVKLRGANDPEIQWFYVSADGESETEIAEAAGLTAYSPEGANVKVVATGTNSSAELSFANVQTVSFDYNLDAHSATLSWDSVQDAAYYNVKISKDGGETWITYRKTTDTTTDLKGLYPGKTYLYRVNDVNAINQTISSVDATIAPISISSSVSSYSDGETISIAVKGSDDAAVDVRWFYVTEDGDVEIEEAAGLLEYAPTGSIYDVRVVATGIDDSEGSNDELVVAHAQKLVLDYDASAFRGVLSWDPIVDAETYNVYLIRDGGDSWITYAKDLTDPSVEIQGLYIGGTYSFRVNSVDASGSVIRTGEASFAPISISTTAKFYIPGEAISVTFKGAEDSTADIRWYYETESGEVEIEEAAGLLEYVPTESNGNIKVVATGTGVSEGSTSSVTINDPVAFTSIVYNTDDATKATITWDAVDNAVSYKVRVSRDGGATWIDYANTEEASFVAQGLYAGNTYYYRAYAYDVDGAVIGVALGTVAPVQATVNVDEYIPGDTITVSIVASDEASYSVKWYNVTDEGDVEIVDLEDQTSYVPSVYEDAQTIKIVVTGADASVNSDTTLVVVPTVSGLNATFDPYITVSRNVSVTWNVVADDQGVDASSYGVQKYTVADDGSIVWKKVATIKVRDGVIISNNATISEDGTQITYKFNMVDAGTTNAYRITAINASSVIFDRQLVDNTTFGLELEHDAYDTTGDTLVASTTPETDAEYQWYASFDKGETWVAINAANEATFTISAEDAAKQLFYKLVAYDEANDCASVVYAEPAVLDAPLDFVRVVDSNDVLNMTFYGVEGAESYQIEYYLADAEYPVWINLTNVDLTVNEDGAVLATRVSGSKFDGYEMRVRATSADGWSAWNADSQPENLAVDSYDSENAEAVITWESVPTAVSYLVEYSKNGGATWTEAATTTDLSATVDNLVAGHSYTLRVTSFKSDATAAGSTELVFSPVSLVSNVEDYVAGETISVTIKGEYDPSSIKWYYTTDEGDVEITEAAGQTEYATDPTVEAQNVKVTVDGTDGNEASNAEVTIVVHDSALNAQFDPYVTVTRSVDTSWTAIDGAKRYAVQKYAAHDDGTWSWVKVANVAATSQTVRMFNAGVDNTFRFIAIDANNVIVERQVVNYSSLGLELDHDAYNTSGDTLIATTAPEVENLTWQWYASSDKGETWIAINAANEPTFELSAEDAAKLFFYKVVATDENANRESVAYAEPDILPNPLNLTKEVNDEGLLVMTFTNVEEAEDYQFEYYLADQDYPVWINLTNVSYTVDETTGLVTATHVNGANYVDYDVRVRATSADGWSDWNGSPEDPSFVVTTADDIVDQYDHLISLREAFLYRGYLISKGEATANDPITFDEALDGATIQLVADDGSTNTYDGVYTDAAKGGTFRITSKVVIDGDDLDVTIDGANTKDHVFYVNGYGTENASAELAVSNLTIANAKMTGDSVTGAAIYSYYAKALTLDNVTFSGNSVESTKTDYRANAGGAAISVSGSDRVKTIVTISNSTFVDNAVLNGTIGGAAISVGTHVDATISNSTFTGNTTNFVGTTNWPTGGGAISVSGFNNTLEVTNSTFVDNSSTTNSAAGSFGGAVFVYSNVVNQPTYPVVTIVDSSFNGNKNAVALFGYSGNARTAGSITLTNSTLTNDSEAAVFNANGKSTLCTIDVVECTITNNAVGVANAAAGKITVMNSTVENNDVNYRKTGTGDIEIIDSNALVDEAFADLFEESFE